MKVGKCSSKQAERLNFSSESSKVEGLTDSLAFDSGSDSSSSDSDDVLKNDPHIDALRVCNFCGPPSDQPSAASQLTSKSFNVSPKKIIRVHAEDQSITSSDSEDTSESAHTSTAILLHHHERFLSLQQKSTPKKGLPKKRTEFFRLADSYKSCEQGSGSFIFPDHDESVMCSSRKHNRPDESCSISDSLSSETSSSRSGVPQRTHDKGMQKLSDMLFQSAALNPASLQRDTHDQVIVASTLHSAVLNPQSSCNKSMPMLHSTPTFSGQAFSPAVSNSVSNLFGLDFKTPERSNWLLSTGRADSSSIPQFGNEPKVPNSLLSQNWAMNTKFM